MSIWMILRISSAMPAILDRRQPLQKVSAYVVDMALHGRARRLAVAAGQGIDDREVLVADLVETLGQAAEAKHGGALAQVADRGREHGIARGLGDGGMKVAVVLAGATQPLAA